MADETTATINIAEASGNFENNIEPTWAIASDELTLPLRSSHTITGGTGATGGRSTHLADIFSADTIGITGYDPKATFISLMAGGDATLALGSTVTDGAGQYFGASVTTDYLTYAQAPDLSLVDTAALNIPNPYVPDISNGAKTAADYKAVFETAHPGTRNSFPPAGATPATALAVTNNLDLNAGDPAATALSPSTTRGRVGGWMYDTSMEYGRWSTDVA